MRKSICLGIFSILSVYSFDTQALELSPNGANISTSPNNPGVSQIVVKNSAGTQDVWTVNSENMALINGRGAGVNFHVLNLQLINNHIYQQDTSLQWSVFNSGTWTRIDDPRLELVTPNGSSVTPSSILVDQQLHVWKVVNGVVYKNGRSEGIASTGAINLLYYNGTVYHQTSAGYYYEDTGLHWLYVAGNPMHMPTKHISSFTGVHCDGVTDDLSVLRGAITGAANNAYRLIIDCPLKLHIGDDIALPIFIDNATSIYFTSQGKFVMDNMEVPGFVIANTHNVSIINTIIEYRGGLPVDPTVSYHNNGKLISSGALSGAQSAFNDSTLTNWLEQNRQQIYDDSLGYVRPFWASPSDTPSLFLLTGDTTNIFIEGLKASVPTTVGGSGYIPMVFAFIRQFTNDQKITAQTPHTSEFMAVPHNIILENIEVDGTLMGFQGNPRDIVFSNIASNRYSDLQDENSENVGGINHWFAPPHLFYLYDGSETDPGLQNYNIQVRGVVDHGVRPPGSIGRTTLANIKTKGLPEGYVSSLKIGGHRVVVDGYETHRKDTAIDFHYCNGMSVSNVSGDFDSSFNQGIFEAVHIYPPGSSAIRLANDNYVNLTVTNFNLTDLAPQSAIAPMTSATRNTANANILFTNMNFHYNLWTGAGSILPTINGQVRGSLIKFVDGQGQVLQAP